MRPSTFFYKAVLLALTSICLVDAADPAWLQRRQVSTVALRLSGARRLEKRSAAIFGWVQKLRHQVHSESDYCTRQVWTLRDHAKSASLRKAAAQAAVRSLKRQHDTLLHCKDKHHGHHPPKPSGHPAPPGRGTCDEIGQALAELILELAKSVAELKQACKDGGDSLTQPQKQVIYEQVENIDEKIKDLAESLVKELGQCVQSWLKNLCKGKIDRNGRASLRLLADYIDHLS